MDGEQKDYNPIPQVGQGSGDQEPPARGRGRGRGGRGRGRGARGRAGGARNSLPTAAQRAAELGISSNATAKSGQAAPTLSALSKMIDAQYPVTAVNETTYQSIIIDPHGYLHLAHAVYQELHMSWRHLHEYISPHEFMLVCCWALVRRIILVRSKIGFVSAAESDFLICMPDITLPAVLAEYLDHIGLIQLPDQTLVYPDIIIPCGILPVNPDDNLYNGMLPVRLSQWDAFQVAGPPPLTMYAHLLPTGLIRRAFDRVAEQPVNAATYLTRFDPANAQAIDGWLSRPKVLSFDCSVLGAPSPQRIAANVFANVYTGESLFGAMNFNPDILAQYINVVPMIEKFVSLRPSTTSTKGSIAQVAFCIAIPRINHGLIDSFSFHSAINLTETELHAARTFRFRRRIHANHCLGAQGQDADVALTLAPASIRVAAPIRISSINSPGLYVNYVCSLFMKARIDRAY